MKVTWVIVGATSAIAKAFAHLVASKGHSLLLVARDDVELNIEAADLRLRYRVACEVLRCDLAIEGERLFSRLQATSDELALFIAASDIVENNELTLKRINSLLQVNVISITQLIYTYLQKNQSQHRIIYLSSVASCRGRSKNSLYGGSKAAIEIYLQGIQQSAPPSVHITIAKLGFIDTIQTYGLPGIFYASPPVNCALACWQASYANKRVIYHPFFWRYLMIIITHLPFFFFKRVRA